MKRIFKFRVWDSIEKRIIEWIQVNNTPLLIDAFSNKNAVAMQFTGLLDKNNKEIYEGDICRYPLKYPSIVGEMYITGEISFDCGSFTWFDRPIDHYYRVSNITSLEIIGNIYEGHK